MGRPRKTPSLSDQISRLDEEIPGIEVALTVQEQRIQAIEAAGAEPNLTLVGAVLEVGAEQRAADFADIRRTLAQLAPAFARLIAGDKIRGALIGDRFPMPRGAKPPFGGLQAVRSVLHGIPDPMRPVELDESALFAEAHEISTATIAQIKGDQP